MYHMLLMIKTTELLEDACCLRYAWAILEIHTCFVLKLTCTMIEGKYLHTYIYIYNLTK